MRDRFLSPGYRPADGWFWYEDEFGKVQARNKLGIIAEVSRHFKATGRPVPYDAFERVMECMCPHQPNGVCLKSSKVTVIRMEAVRENTKAFFGKTVATYDVIEKRLLKCQTCEAHDRKFCPGCTGYPQWIDKGFGGHRKPMPVDQACGVCKVDKTLVSAAATVESPEALGKEAPDGCWRH